jgi:Protein kinase domain
MLEALEFLHSKRVRVIHRDIKPDNILYNDPSHFVLADFGSAVIGLLPIAQDGNCDMLKYDDWEIGKYGGSHAGKYGGCVEYMAPECYSNASQTSAVDIWALGILCLDMLGMVARLSAHHHNIEVTTAVEWCEGMCRLAEHSDRPELKMMVLETVEHRSTAAEVLGFAKNPSNQMQHYRPTEDLLYFILRSTKEFRDWSEKDIRYFASDYLKTRPSQILGQSPPPPGPLVSGSVGSAGPTDSTAIPGSAESGTQELCGRIVMLGMCEEKFPGLRGAFAEQIPRGSQGTAAPSGSTAPSESAQIDTQNSFATVLKFALASGLLPHLSKAVAEQMAKESQRTAGSSTPAATPAPLAVSQPQPPRGTDPRESGRAVSSGSTAMPPPTRWGESGDILTEADLQLLRGLGVGLPTEGDLQLLQFLEALPKLGLSLLSPTSTESEGTPGPSSAAARSQLRESQGAAGTSSAAARSQLRESQGAAGTSSAAARPQYSGAQDVIKPNPGRSRHIETQGEQPPRGPKAQSHQGKAKVKQPPTSAPRPTEAQSQQGKATPKNLPGPSSGHLEAKSPQVEARAKQPTPPSLSHPEDQVQRTEPQARQSLSPSRRPKIQSQQGDAKTKQPSSSSPPRPKNQSQGDEPQPSKASPPSSSPRETQGQQGKVKARQSSPSSPPREEVRMAQEPVEARKGALRPEDRGQRKEAEARKSPRPIKTQEQQVNAKAKQSSALPPSRQEGRMLQKSAQATEGAPRPKDKGQQKEAQPRQASRQQDVASGLAVGAQAKQALRSQEGSPQTDEASSQEAAAQTRAASRPAEASSQRDKVFSQEASAQAKQASRSQQASPRRGEASDQQAEPPNRLPARGQGAQSEPQQPAQSQQQQAAQSQQQQVPEEQRDDGGGEWHEVRGKTRRRSRAGRA